MSFTVDTSGSTAVPVLATHDSENPKRVRITLFLAAALASVVVIPYVYLLLSQRPGKPRAFSEQASDIASEALFEMIITWCLIVLGLRARRALGQGVSLLAGWPPANDEAKIRLRKTLILAVVVGLLIGAADGVTEYFIEPLMPKPVRPLVDPPAWAGFLASIGAGIQEEIWCPLGIMTALVWFGTRLLRRSTPGAGTVWIANVLAAFLFGALHLPQAALFYGLSTLVASFTLLGNGIPGIVFGWLYWRYGLATAMIAHFAADVVLKCVLPLLGLS
jgi:hypothetical protein